MRRVAGYRGLGIRGVDSEHSGNQGAVDPTATKVIQHRHAGKGPTRLQQLEHGQLPMLGAQLLSRADALCESVGLTAGSSERSFVEQQMTDHNCQSSVLGSQAEVSRTYSGCFLVLFSSHTRPHHTNAFIFLLASCRFLPGTTQRQSRQQIDASVEYHVDYLPA